MFGIFKKEDKRFVKTTLRFRNVDDSNFHNSGVVSRLGEVVVNRETGEFKIGDGITPTYALPVSTKIPVEVNLYL